MPCCKRVFWISFNLGKVSAILSHLILRVLSSLSHSPASGASASRADSLNSAQLGLLGNIGAAGDALIWLTLLGVLPNALLVTDAALVRGFATELGLEEEAIAVDAVALGAELGLDAAGGVLATSVLLAAKLGRPVKHAEKINAVVKKRR